MVMYKIVETQAQFKEFISKCNGSDVILHPIMSDHNLHPLNNDICGIYIKIIDGDSYFLSFNHSESLNLSIDLLKDLKCFDKVYCLDKKVINHIFNFDNVYDVSLLYYLNTNKVLDIEKITTNSHTFFYQRYYRFKNINRIIPIVKHIELCDKIVELMETTIKTYQINDVYDTYNKVVIPNLSYIENNGIYVEPTKVDLNHKKHVNDNNLLFSEYNIFTSTGRPSNRFGGINFAALNKDDGSREPFQSRYGKNGMLVEYDFDSYHVRLIADIIGYKFPNGSVHKYLGDQYGIDDYNESKGMTFKLLYGGIPKEVSDNIPFFGKVSEYIKIKWREYKRSFSVKSDIYNREIKGQNLFNMNSNKLFNYLIQLDETENNMNVITGIKDYLKDKHTKLVLYNYDSFLFDYCQKDGKNILNEIKNIIENNKFPTKVKAGKNYDSLVDVTEKINGF